MASTSSPATPLAAEADSLTSGTAQPGRLVVLTGPSGVGKGTLLGQVRQRHPDLYLSTSTTTRLPRPGEVNGREYYFVDRDRFETMIQQGELLEWAEFAGNYYGTPRQPVAAQIEQGNQVILEIELEGARQVAENFPAAFRIFVEPPSWEELERRIRDRGQDAEAAIARRLDRARVELAAAPEFDLQIVNDDLDQAAATLEAVLFAPIAATAP